MVSRGIKVADRILESQQVQWLILRREQCPDEAAERRVVARHFPLAHEPWGSNMAFVHPVVVKRSRRRVLFLQESGVAI